MKPWIISLFVLLYASSLSAQEITVDVDPQNVEVGQTFTYTIDASISGGAVIQLGKLPDFKNFTQLGTQSAPRLININGKVTRGLSIFVRLKAKKKGTYQLDGPVLNFGKNSVKGPPTKISVYPVGKLKKTNDVKKHAGYFIQARRSPTGDLYVGQQVNVDYELFTAGAGNSGPQPPSEPELDEFWIEDLSQKNTGTTQLVTVKGKMMRKTTLRSYALFPLKSGPLTINAMEMELLLGSMFRSKTIKIASDPIKLKVKPLPANAPKGFYEGNVGSWKLKTSASARRVKTGEPFVLTISVSGKGQIGRIRLPVLPQLEGGAVATRGEESTEKDIRWDDKNQNVFGTKVVEYSIVPKQVGSLEVPSLTFSYFDPEAGSYRSIKSEPIKLSVVKGKEGQVNEPQKKRAEPNKRGSTDDIIKELETNLIPFDGASTRVRTREQPILLFIGLAFPAFLGLLWLFFGDRIRRFLARTAKPNERDEISNLNALIEDLDTVDGISDVKRALLIAVGLPAGASMKRLKQTLLEKTDEVDVITEIIAIFDREQMLKYNPDLKDPINIEALKNTLLKVVPKLAVFFGIFFLFSYSLPANASKLLKDEGANIDDPHFYYRVADDAIKTKDYGIARWALERAVYLSPGFEEASRNLDIVNQVVRIRSIEASNRGLTLDGNESIFWWRFFGNMSSMFWGMIFVLFWWVSFALFFFARRSKPKDDSKASARRDALFTFGIISLTIAVLLTATVLIRWHIRRTVDPAVVISPTLVLKEGPNQQANTLPAPRTVVPGVMLNVNQRRGKWSRIEFPDGTGAWVEGNGIWFVQQSSKN